MVKEVKDGGFLVVVVPEVVLELEEGAEVVWVLEVPLEVCMLVVA